MFLARVQILINPGVPWKKQVRGQFGYLILRGKRWSGIHNHLYFNGLGSVIAGKQGAVLWVWEEGRILQFCG